MIWRSRLAQATVGLLAFLAVVGRPDAATRGSFDVDQAIAIVKTDDPKGRVDAAAYLIDVWPEALPALIRELDAYAAGRAGRPYSDADAPALANVTDVVRAIVVNQKGGIEAFRANDSDRTARLLAWAARGDNRALRLNATFILANVADNTNVCIVLHHLRDPEISVDGMVNLIQVAATVASYAYAENVKATNDTIANLKRRLTATELPKTEVLIAALAERVAKSSNGSKPLPPRLSFCASYDYGAPL